VIYNSFTSWSATSSLKEVLDIIGGKWAMPIVYRLSKGKMRFKELERSVEGIEEYGN